MITLATTAGPSLSFSLEFKAVKNGRAIFVETKTTPYKQVISPVSKTRGELDETGHLPYVNECLMLIRITRHTKTQMRR